jgi:hypothetical protein
MGSMRTEILESDNQHLAVLATQLKVTADRKLRPDGQAYRKLRKATQQVIEQALHPSGLN